MVVMAVCFFALSWRGLWDYSISCDETLLGRVVFANGCVWHVRFVGHLSVVQL